MKDTGIKRAKKYLEKITNQKLPDDIKEWAGQEGHTWRTVMRGKKELGVIAQKIGPFDNSRWYWCLPGQEGQTPKDAKQPL